MYLQNNINQGLMSSTETPLNGSYIFRDTMVEACQDGDHTNDVNKDS